MHGLAGARDALAIDRPQDFLPASELSGPELSIVVPTFKERQNVPLLVAKLGEALKGTTWEVVFVDDNSPDATAKIARQLARRDRRVRVIQRIGRRGLSSAVVEGILSTSAPFVAVMDADLQHDEKLLPSMLSVLKNEGDRIVIGSRYVELGSVGAWNEKRQLISKVATKLSQLIVRADLADPMSGFFMLTRETFERSLGQLSIQGYKILLDILASSPEPPRILELPYTFRERHFGESKLDSAAVLEYLLLLIDKLLGGAVPVRFVLFSLIGGLGLLVHMGVLAVAMNAMAASFASAQAFATLIAMTFNFYLNNWLTYRDRRLIGWRPVLHGLLSFYLVCSLGAVANVGIANFMFSDHYSWWLAGVAGVLIGAVWNYAASSLLTWRSR